MPHPPSDPTTITLPRWAYIAATVAILFHLGAVGVRVFAAQSGPWPMPGQGAGQFPPPVFAAKLSDSLPGDYLKFVHLDRDYHFENNQVSTMTIKMEVRLKNDQEETAQKLTFPEEDANFWVRHRQQLMVRLLSIDTMMPTQQTKQLAAPGKEESTITYFEDDGRNHARIVTKSVNNAPLASMVRMPTDFSLVFLRSYSRYLNRQHGAKWADVTRVEQDPIPPGILFEPNPQPMMFEARSFNYGELSK